MDSIHSSIHEAYLGALEDVWYKYQFKSAPRGLPCREILNYSFTVTNPVVEPILTRDPDRNLVIADYTKKEMELYNSGTNLVADFGQASKFWFQLANPDKTTINSAYGHLIWKNKSCGNPLFEGLTHGFGAEGMKTPWQWCVKSLQQDKDTRQAVLRFNLPEHAWNGVKDFPCTMHGNFLIRDDRLYLSIVMRSNDLMKGLVFDAPFFISLMDKMVVELLPTYPDLTKGSYSHLSHSMHIYEKDEAAILKMLGFANTDTNLYVELT